MNTNTLYQNISEDTVTLDDLIGDVLGRHDVAIGAAEQRLRQVAGIAEDDDAADLALYDLASATNAAMIEAANIAFWAGVYHKANVSE